MKVRLPRAAVTALTLLSGLPTVAPVTAANRYLGFGDSITAGVSWPSDCPICPVIFDCTSICDDDSPSERDKCSYAKRLDDWLGSGNYVRNEGVGGEDTMEGVERMPAEMVSNCDDQPQDDCIAVFLMEGTNDDSHIPPIPPEATRTNLNLMIDEVKSHDVDVVMMTIIRKVYEEDDLLWEAYRDEMISLAASENLQIVDPYTPLCPNFPCFQANYWVADKAPCFDPDGDPNLGHLDPDGYEVLTDLIQDIFPASTPPAPSPTSPAGDTTDADPIFTWPAQETARWYQIEVDGDTTWWEKAEHCTGTCEVDLGSFPEGTHSWRVRGRNLRGLGAWSADTDFDIILEPPAAPTATGPAGPLFETAPAYEWLAVAGADDYDLEVRDGSDVLAAEASDLDADSVCTGGLCSHVEGTVLAQTDTYGLRVRGGNGVGDGPFSEPHEFQIFECADSSPTTLEALVPPPVTTTEEAVHCGPIVAAEAGAYVVEESGDLAIHTRDGFTAHNGFTVSGRLSIKSP